MRYHRFILAGLSLLAAACATTQDEGSRLASVDHYVKVKSTAPGHAGKESRIYVREVALAGAAARNATANGVVLFVHGAMDMTGYGRSTRPAAMDDACNFSKQEQGKFVPAVIAAPCTGSSPSPITTMSSDWDDIGAVVDHLRRMRGVDKVALVAWSQGGPRAGGYAARNPAKVSRLVVLAPSYARNSALDASAPLPPGDGWMTSQSGDDFTKNWDRQVGCPDQYEAAARDAIWADMLASDPTGAKWGPGVRRAPRVPTWGFNQAVVSKMQTPFLMVAGEHDKQVVPSRVRDLYTDLGSKEKVYIELACSSHNAMWEKNRLLLYKASLDWLKSGNVNGQTQAEMKLGY